MTQHTEIVTVHHKQGDEAADFEKRKRAAFGEALKRLRGKVVVDSAVFERVSEFANEQPQRYRLTVDLKE